MSEAATYISPTTPGKPVTFTNYVTELVCLNKQRNLQPSFWKLPEWHKRYANELRGVLRWAKMHEEKLSEPLFQKAVLAAIRWVQPATMMPAFMHAKLDRRVNVEYQKLLKQAETLAEKASVCPPAQNHDEFMRRTMPLANVGERTKFSRILEIEGSNVETEATGTQTGAGGV